MISRRVKLQLIVFLAITVVGVIYAGLRYVGFHPFGIGAPYQVSAEFTDSGGIFNGAQVTERGEVVGKVTDMTLIPGGVAVHLAIDPSFKIPADSSAAVQDLSAVGEQYVDLTPGKSGGPYLHAGSVIPVSRTSIPVNDAVILSNFDKLVNSVDLNQLKTVVTELGAAFQGTGPALQQLIDAGDALTAAAQENLPIDISLINNSKVVLGTQEALNGDLQAFAANLAGLSGQLVRSDPDLRSLLSNGVVASQQITGLLDDNRSALPTFLNNLVTLAQIQDVRLPGLKVILTVYPANVANGFLTAAGGHAHFSIATSSNPPDCTQGYNTRQRSFAATSGPSVGGPANLNAYCTSNYSAANAPDVRGAAAAPHYGDGTQAPPPGGYQQLPGASSQYGPPPASSSSSSSGSTSGSGSLGAAPGNIVAPYDPRTGIVRLPDGSTVQLGSTGGQGAALGGQSWEWLLVAPVFG